MLIIFIAMVPVAAIASALLIKSTGILEQRAQETSEEATAKQAPTFAWTG